MRLFVRLVQSALAAGFVFVLPIFLGYNALFHRAAPYAGMAHARPLHDDALLSDASRSSDVEVFSEPVVSVVFDDGWESIYRNALPILEEYGIASTQFMIAGSFADEQYMSIEQMLHMIARGHEVGSHTMTHADLTMLDQQELSFELGRSQAILEQHTAMPIADFVAPLGAHNDATIGAVQTLYRSHRTTLSGINTADNFDPYRLLSPTILASDTNTDIALLVAEAQAVNGWLILTYHQIDDSDTVYSVDVDTFRTHMQALVEANVDIVPYGHVLDVVEEQLNG